MDANKLILQNIYTRRGYEYKFVAKYKNKDKYLFRRLPQGNFIVLSTKEVEELLPVEV